VVWITCLVEIVSRHFGEKRQTDDYFLYVARSELVGAGGRVRVGKQWYILHGVESL